MRIGADHAQAQLEDTDDQGAEDHAQDGAAATETTLDIDITFFAKILTKAVGQ